jgi:hypothetical protein
MRGWQFFNAATKPIAEGVRLAGCRHHKSESGNRSEDAPGFRFSAMALVQLAIAVSGNTGAATPPYDGYWLNASKSEAVPGEDSHPLTMPLQNWRVSGCSVSRKAYFDSLTGITESESGEPPGELKITGKPGLHKNEDPQG